MKEKKLIWQLYPSYLLVIFITLILLLTYTSSAFKTFYINQTTKDLRARTVLIEKQVTPYFKSQDFNKLTLLISEQGKEITTRFTIVDAKGNVLSDSDENPEKMDNHASRPEIAQALSDKWGMATRYSRTLQTKMLYIAKPIKQNNQVIGVVRSSISINELDNTLRGLIEKMVLWGILISIFSAMIGFFVSRKISGPIKDFSKGADELSNGNFDFQLPVPKIQEFRQLAEAFNNMSFQLKDRMQTIINHSSEKEAILSNMVEGIITVDKESNITTMNQAAKHYFHIEKEAVVGHSINEIIRHTTIQKVIQKALITQELIEEDIALTHPQELFLHVHGMCLTNANEECVGALIVLHNLTRIRKLENMRKNFVANVSHELKTPITLIKGFLETLFRGALDDKKEREEFLTIIQEHTIRLEAIIEDLLSLSRIEQENENNLIETDNESLNEVIEKAISSCQKKATNKEISIVFNSSKKLNAKINFSLIEQALINLIDNAIKYSPAKSQIEIVLTQSPSENTITVIDQGCGIPKKHIPHLFERFYRVDNARSRELGGTGLGLAIVKHIAESHKGIASLKSAEGKGSQFSIHIPIIQKQSKEQSNV
ncbi:PAS domain-containing sensor histidine kinase [Candidatus Marinamargulisbacteria bacterium SCGC AAA071-K20]|nr:PAS domain-containing sensor histidine kinase [Candidatus Marinamargulisbacteria bacterium SCGC AAA071-K20]